MGKLDKTEDFVERFEHDVVVGLAPSGFIIIEFLRSDITTLTDDKGRITGHEGVYKTSTRIFIPPIVAKKLKEGLEKAIKGYEEKFGEIKIPEGEKP